MADMFKKVKDGEKLKIPARTYNAMVDAAQDYCNRKNNIESSSGGSLSSNIVHVKNSTSNPIDRFGILGISGTEIETTSENFKQTIVLTGDLPSTSNHSGGRFVIAVEPIAAGSIGTAYASGICIVQIDVQAESHNFADIKDSDAGKLVSCESGPAVILYKDTGTGTKWGLIRFGASSPAGNEIRRAKLTTSAGSGNTVTANLYDSNGIEQTSGDESGVTVYCNINKQQPAPFGTHLSSCIPRLFSGQEITVIKIPCRIEDENHLGTYITVQRWYCTTVFQIMSIDFLDIDSDGALYVKLAVCED